MFCSSLPLIKGGTFENLNVICGTPPKTAITTESSTSVTTTLHLSLGSSSIASSKEFTSVGYTNENTDATISSNTTTVGSKSLSIESTQDVPENMICKYKQS